MNFGSSTSEEHAHTIMDMAHEAGINFFDTANRYGTEPGETEMIIGNWFATGGGRRERTVIATKVYGEMGDWPNEGKLSALNIRRPSHQSARPVYRRLRPGTHAPVLGDGAEVSRSPYHYLSSGSHAKDQAVYVAMVTMIIA